MILDKAAHKLKQKFVWGYSIDKSLTENAAIYKQHCGEEKVPDQNI